MEQGGDAKIMLVSKESLWQLLSKCQEPGCSEHCEISSHNKGQTFEPFFLNDSEIERNWQLDIIFFMTCYLHRSSSCGENDLHSRSPERMVIMSKCWGKENFSCIHKC